MIKPNNRILVEIGNGDILVNSFLCHGGIGVLTLKDAEEPMEIGASIPHDDEQDPFDVPVVITFSDIRSLDVVLDHLNFVRVHMKDWEDGKFDEEETK